MAEGRRRSATTAERLGRMLVIVPYLVQHPGTSLDAASALFGVPAAQLRRDLDLLFLSGLPPYGPGDLIDVDVDEDGCVWIAMADHFARPLRLTRQEALAVTVRATELLATPGVPEAPALASALAKLRVALGADTLGDLAGIAGAEAGGAPPHLEALRQATDGHRRVRIEYVAASTGERSSRTIEPESVFASAGHWYAAAWDVDVDGERLFRIDRIAATEATDVVFEPRGLEGATRPLYTPTADDTAVRLLLRPPARWVAEYYATTDVRVREDGSVEATFPARRTGWIARLLLRLAPDAEPIEPPELADEVRELARQALAVYAG
ncbi:MAG TPA: WYL domain-containing protein [Actinomycetota bacterium]|nr:WYL domain-containing protein [Actinomycetota bacterium]